MGHNNGRLTAPLSTDDVAITIEEASYDVGTLCSSSKINMWAKYKPEKVGGPQTLYLSQRQANNFGIEPSVIYPQPTTFRTAVFNGTFNGGWKYNRPSPSNGDWARLDDFLNSTNASKVGYNHYAKKPFGTLNAQTIVLYSQTTDLLIPLEAPDMGDSADADGLLTIADLTKSGYDFANWYFGILLWKNSSTYRMATTKAKIGATGDGAGDWQVTFGSINGSAWAGTWKAVPFLSSEILNWDGNDVATAKIVGIGTSGVEITIKTRSEVVVPFANCQYTDDSKERIHYDVTITNNNSTATTCQNVCLRIATSDSGANDYTLRNFGTVTIPGGTTWHQNGTLSRPQSRDYQFCTLTYTGSATQWINFEQRDEGEVPEVVS